MRRKRIIAATAFVLVILLGVAAVQIYRYIEARKLNLFEAASSGNALATRRLIARGVDVNARDSDGGTALFYAAGFAHPKVLQLLLEAGADVSILDDRGRTALCYSIMSRLERQPALR
jgi:ankyrin repeat protein